MTSRRVGLLGGAFNPPHDGHLKLARLALEHLELDELRFIPTALSPHKPDPGGPAGPVRLRLLERLLEAADGPFRIETLELARGGRSYTVDTLEDLAAREPGSGWILIMGSDQLPGLSHWHRAPRIFQLASVAISPRPGTRLDDLAVPGLRPADQWSGRPGERVWLPPTDLDLASTALRGRLAADPSADPGGLPPQVLAAIRSENLYR
ncbi:putative nicotinate-nucleotide adenylyltransferase [Geothrix rubra]|uniref:Probable nicotinate-nucleotide adenylyltransferase n=1 Tax=Geothrix rubra TaxID=2927977 RepID=A0ABQ5Q8B7_9BACT|nr:nicotinate (nicotinamide) nucleotide adenylyltransferase [Geothrix rubra]GLH70759.1 putative nicotinate-nucleotide adenylyltransferase [Geothrix rubra]